MHKVVSLLTTLVLGVGTTAIVDLPIRAQVSSPNAETSILYNRNGLPVQAPGSSNASNSKIPDRSASYHNGFSINYSQGVSSATDGQQASSTSSSTSTWNRQPATETSVSVPEPSTLLGLAGVTALCIFKGRSLHKI